MLLWVLLFTWRCRSSCFSKFITIYVIIFLFLHQLFLLFFTVVLLITTTIIIHIAVVADVVTVIRIIINQLIIETIIDTCCLCIMRKRWICIKYLWCANGVCTKHIVEHNWIAFAVIGIINITIVAAAVIHTTMVIVNIEICCGVVVVVIVCQSWQYKIKVIILINEIVIF